VKRSLLLVLGLAVVAIAAFAYLEGGDSQRAPSALADDDGGARAVLRNAAGEKVGKVKFSQHHGGVQVKVTIDAPLATLIAGFHGFHVHETGTCTPAGFTSAGFHFPTGTDANPLPDLFGKLASGATADDARIEQVAIAYRDEAGRTLGVLTASTNVIRQFIAGEIDEAAFSEQLHGDVDLGAALEAANAP